MKNNARILFPLFVLLLASGCMMTKKTKAYLLRPDEHVTMQCPNVVVIDGLHLSGYLERSCPVKRLGRHSVDVHPNMAWAQDFRSMVKETLTTNLMLRCQKSGDAKIYRALVHFMRLEVDDNTGKFNVSVLCTMKCGKALARRHFEYQYDCAGRSGEALIDLYDKALSELADKLCEMTETISE